MNKNITNLPNELTENGIHYTLHGDYYLPDMSLPEAGRKTLGKYGQMRMDYLKEYRPVFFSRLLLSGKLMPLLYELDQRAHDRLKLIIRQMASTEGVTEEMKAADPMEWVRQMNSIHNRAEEMVMTEMIYD